MKMKKRSRRYDVNKPMAKHGHKYTKYKECLSVMMRLYALSNISATFEAPFRKKLSNTEVELKKKHFL